MTVEIFALGSAPVLGCWRSRPGFADFFKGRFGETPKPTRETRALPKQPALTGLQSSIFHLP